MSLITLIILSCGTTEPVIICGAMDAPLKISAKMIDSYETEDSLYELYGYAVDNQTGEPAPFLKILFRSNDVFITGCTTDWDGNFKIKLDPGVYQMECAYAGYETYTSELTALDGIREKMQISLGD